ncbi:unnamed protein product [Phaedon cochleariae]|uniref:Transcriptional coactivator p15 (PC4) C-terminal domain-containing protein n=1 Tax=Phaedon cochleariae TaxID=80249 RepID=A0A9P0GPB2_PHACE|nr:unnamed protein product [Phaedon cochleariae]
MPKNKSRKEEDSDSDSGPDDKVPAKKSKSNSKSSKSESASTEENSWSLGKNRFVKLTEFKNKWYIDVREYYTNNDGDMKPGRKGIMLTMDQWQKFKDCIGEIDDAIKENV